MTQTLLQAAIEAIKAAAQAKAVARAEAGPGPRSEAANTGTKLSRPTLKQPIFDWGTTY